VAVSEVAVSEVAVSELKVTEGAVTDMTVDVEEAVVCRSGGYINGVKRYFNPFFIPRYILCLPFILFFALSTGQSLVFPS
jgi:hypothetical protein